ncbi:hypothetical protein [Phormidium sp. CCY1219]|uniref:hypothetical protein n=1 Tax=Phormidium sp. CCY1219 TaxID=2886104 RepID=UPI002D1EB140|nr:hypothetical protein [Phormidium sp. CCY1219]MEB3831887.1 hypothetical protein [Phormidium sp. CCY1219]
MKKSQKWNVTRHFLRKVDSNFRASKSEYTNRSYPIWTETPEEERFLLAKYFLAKKYNYELPFVGGLVPGKNVWQEDKT